MSSEFQFLHLLSDVAHIHESRTFAFCPKSRVLVKEEDLVRIYIKCHVYRADLDIYIKPISSRSTTKIRRITENTLLFSRSLQDWLPSSLVDKKVLVRGDNFLWEYYPAILLEYDKRHILWKIEDIFGSESWQHLKNLFLIIPNLETSEMNRI